MKISLLVIFGLVLSASAALAIDQAANIESGDTITVTMDSGFHAGKVSEIAATYAIADIGFYDQVIIPDPKTGTISRQLTIDAPPGIYLLITKLYVNKKISKTQETLLTVHAIGTLERPVQQPPAQQPPQGAAKPASPKPTSPQSPVGPRPIITIPPIPDVEPGEGFIVPVTITGNGYFEVTVPELDFGTYNAPEYVLVEGEARVPILVHINADATPGLHVLQVAAGDQHASARIRIIKYHQASMWWLLIPLGILLVILGVLLIFQFTRREPREPPMERVPPPRDNTDNTSGELITYY